MTDKRLITPEDLYRMHWVNDPVVSPVSGAIAYVHKSVSEKFDGYRSHIRLLPAEGDQDVPFTSGEADAAPAWSPDGSELAFLRKRAISHRYGSCLPTEGSKTGYQLEARSQRL